MKRLFLFIAALAAATTAAQAQMSPSPYDMKFTLRDAPAGGVPLYSGMATGSKVIATIPGNATGIILRWCRPELPFQAWQFGSLKAQRGILDEAWCEIQTGGKIGNVEGKVLDPIR